jgi:EAL domain-containing protein (putative c-di-GMP-specific phosphodiesterase class I)
VNDETPSKKLPAPGSNRLSDAPSAKAKSVPPESEAIDSLEILCDMVSPEELSVVFQPIVALASGEVFANEALVRCSAAEFPTPPVLFERAAEAGITGRLGRMIREIGVPLSNGPLFVNIHPRELAEGWLVRPDDPIFLHDDDVYLEVTESVPFSHFELCLSVAREVGSRAGVYLVVDDLGAGYSNLARIADLAPRIVKLDRQLVAGIDEQPRRRELVSAIVELCTRLGADVVAEGIETVGELHAVADAGCRYGQGYLLARPGYPIPPVYWPESAPRRASQLPSRMPPTRKSKLP